MKNGFVGDLDVDQQAYFAQLRSAILENDAHVKEKVGDVMSAKNGLVYLHEDTFKYALTMSKNHFSFHSMVMYANQDIWRLTGTLLPHVKKQKGCINFKTAEQLPVEPFIELIQKSAEKDFSPVIAHYQKKK